jgi:D-glycero-D-manno-heptose 1,7-bisphosphate phosphatase
VFYGLPSATLLPLPPACFALGFPEIEMNQAVFLDRDGTIIVDKHYLRHPEQVVPFPDAIPALTRLQTAGFRLFIVSNQSGVGRGYFTLEEVELVNDHLVKEFGRSGVHFEKIYIAPEAPEAPSRGRKPSPQFLFDARDEFGVSLGNSFMIGDKLSDLECGWNAGVQKSILVRTGSGAELERSTPEKLTRALIVNNLADAVEFILNTEH